MNKQAEIEESPKKKLNKVTLGIGAALAAVMAVAVYFSFFFRRSGTAARNT